jgi:lipopolysaccharide heptosyltransferase II
VQRILIIQTAFLGDVVLATALIESLHARFPDARIDFLLRKGNEAVLAGHPILNQILIWNKQQGKFRNLWNLARQIRRNRYDLVVNPHRGINSGFLTVYSGARMRQGFSKNPLQQFYTFRAEHGFSKPGDAHFLHETERNHRLIRNLTDAPAARPRLYPQASDLAKVQPLQTEEPYICIAPSSVWMTKRYPMARWVQLIDALPADHRIYLLGGPEDKGLASDILKLVQRGNVHSLCGELRIMESAALMGGAVMNYTNDSGPMHFASSLNAPVTAVYCSTHPCFGFGPLSDHHRIVDAGDLYCRPCGIHGYPACPQGHFRCATDIRLNDLLWWTSPTT